MTRETETSTLEASNSDLDIMQLCMLKAELLSTMSNATRLKILSFLTDKEASVGEIVDHVGLSQSAVSQHLGQLRRSKLIKTRRSGQNIFYFEPSRAVRSILFTLASIEDSRVSNPNSGEV